MAMPLTYHHMVAVCRRYECWHIRSHGGTHFWVEPDGELVKLLDVRVRVVMTTTFNQDTEVGARFMAGSTVATSTEYMRTWLSRNS